MILLLIFGVVVVVLLHLPAACTSHVYVRDWTLYCSTVLPVPTLPASLSGTFPPNSARFGYATEGALIISAQLSSDTVSALRKVREVGK